MLDAGTGMTNVTALLDGAPYVGSVLLGHLHWDHTHGMPFFAGGGAAAAGSSVDPRAGRVRRGGPRARFSPPHFPIVPSQLGPGWTFGGLAEGRHEIEGFAVLAREIPHKGGRTFGFRVEPTGPRWLTSPITARPPSGPVRTAWASATRRWWSWPPGPTC